MKRFHFFWMDCLWTLLILFASLSVNQVIQHLFQTQTLIPMLSVLGVFFISLKTHGYVWGIIASVVSVLAVNFAFTYPYFTLDFFYPEGLFSAIVMLVVAVITSTLVTTIKQHEQDRSEGEKEKLRANLLRATSHDLRTPLTAIYGAASVMIENYDTLQKEHHIRFLEEIQEEAEWLTRMVENLLSVTRIDREIQIQKTSTVLEELIDMVLVKFKKHCPHQPVTVTIPAEFISIPMDAVLIGQVILNILENAVIHAKGMTELLLTVSRSGDQAVFEIADNGCGIPPERLSTLFSGRQEAEPDLKIVPADSGRKNMGIGLSVCAAIIRTHGGTIQADNRPGGGMVFRFSLAMEEEPNEQ